MNSLNPSKTCPLCGKPNGCQAGQKERCWCYDVNVPEALLQKIPLDKKGKACICKECIGAFINTKNEDL